jgi:putative copper export protein
MITAIYTRKSTEQERTKRRFCQIVALAGFALALSSSQLVFAQVGRYQVVPDAAGSILLDTVTGCTWQIALDPTTKKVWFAFIPRAGAVKGTTKILAMVPSDCVVLDGVVEEAWLKSLEKGAR